MNTSVVMLVPGGHLLYIDYMEFGVRMKGTRQIRFCIQ